VSNERTATATTNTNLKVVEELAMTMVVYDNGGASFDRYTVIIDEDVIGMSENPQSPQGFNQYVGDASEFGDDLSHLGEEVPFAALPLEVQRAINDRAAS
jgi:hypothetical protein